MSYDPYQPPRAEASGEGSNGVSLVGLLASAFLAVGVGSQVIEILAWLSLDSATYGSVQRIVSAIGGFARVAGIIAFLTWIHRIVSNAHSFGVKGLKYKPGGAVGFWFVPFVNLVHGYRVVSEVWKASNPETAGAAPYAWLSTGRPSNLILHWWLAYMTSRIAILATRFAWTPAVWVIGVGFEIAALMLLVIVIRRLDLRQSAYVQRRMFTESPDERT